MSSLMAYQTPFRAHLRVFEQQGDIIKFHPFVDIDEGEFLFYLDKYQLPRHPLEKHGYGSIGCVHCTAKGKGRALLHPQTFYILQQLPNSRFIQAIINTSYIFMLINKYKILGM